MHKQELADSGSQSPIYAGFLAPAITIGFAAAALMWVLAWALHMPGMHVSNAIAIPLLLLPLLIVAIRWVPGVDPKQRLKAAGVAGLIAGLVNLMILGSHIVEQPESTAEMGEKANALAPNAALVVLGSIAVSIVVALIGAVVVKSRPAPTAGAPTWRSRFAWVTALTYLPLIAVGGVVTTTDSGLAVPDAVTSYGAVSVLFPLKLMAEPRIFFEHSHRLFGTLAGLTTIVLMIKVLLGEKRLMPKLLSVVLFVAVSAQGVLGIIRVAEKSTFFAIVHGVFAQLVLALALVTAVTLSPRWLGAAPTNEVSATARKARTMMLLTVIALSIQLILGAVTRHMNSSHAMMSHLGFAFVAMALVMVGGAMCMRAGKLDASGRALKPMGAAMHGLVTLQFVLGFAVLGLAWQGDDAPPIPTAEMIGDAPAIEPAAALVTTAHHLTGAFVLATACCALAWAVRLASGPKAR